MKGKIYAMFLILSISISPTKSAIFENFALLYIAFAKCLKIAIFRTFINRVILLSINVFELFLPWNKFEMIP